MTVGGDRAGNSVRAMPLVATLAATYVISQLLRGSVAVIAPDLAAELDLSSSELGLLSSAFFLAFSAAQLPLGVALDRYGARTLLLGGAFLVVAGTALFAAAPTPGLLVAARLLMGLGTSCYLVGPLALYARCFPPERFSSLAGIHLGIGGIGALLATAPLAVAAAAIGWRSSFLAIAAWMGVMGGLIALVVRDPAPAVGRTHERERLRDSVKGIREALATDSVGRLFLMHMTAYSSFALVVGLWGGPYLSHVYGYGLTERGALLLVPAGTQIAGLVLYASAGRILRSHKAPVMIGGLLTVAFLGVLAAVGSLPPSALLAWLAGFGLVSGFSSAVIAHGKVLFASRLVGRGLTLLNMGTMSGVFLTQSATGFAIDLFPQVEGVYPTAAYQVVFAFQAVFLVIAMIAYVPARDSLAVSPDV
jgi:MFS family permease